MPVMVSVTYRAPKGDNKVCELFGRTFFDGQAVEIEDNEENQHAIAKLARNRFFEVAKSAAAKVKHKLQDRVQARLQADPEPEPEPEPEPDPEPEPEPEPELEPEPKRKTAPASHKPVRRAHK
jgi:outer membrane biosynthesis protein TonB